VETFKGVVGVRNADHPQPLRSEKEGTEVFDYPRRLEEETAAN
jgi:hypothetical protein